MYPLRAERPWPINQWYVAGFSSEVDNVIRRRTFLGRRIVMFRDEKDEPHAMSSVCPHRMMPLENGKLDGDRLVCAYHGLSFDLHTGQCVKSPTSRVVPKCSLITYPIREIKPLVWIWVGEPTRADTTPVPAQGSIGIGQDRWATQCVDYKLLNARYSLLIDNLFDLSHIYYIHYSIIGESGEMNLSDPGVEQRDGRLVVYREVNDVATDGFDRFSHPEVGERVCRRSETELVGISMINAGNRAVDGASWDSPHLGYLNFIHVLTPETETTTHYWAMLTRDFRIDDEKYSRALADLEVAVIGQDREALEKIEAMLQSTADLPREISMPADRGALQARKRIVAMIRSD